jgi:cytochrome c-type biogenesis protein CcmH
VSGRRGWIPWAVLGVLAVGVLAWAAWPSGEPSDADRATTLAHELRCPDCESLSAADSQTASARAIRRDLKERIAEGQSDATIRRAYVDRYGESILLKPEQGGLGLIVWGLPVLLLVVGAGGLFLAFRRWRGSEPLRPSAADEQLVEELRRTERSP